MSYRGWIDIDISVDGKYEDEARAWAKLHGFSAHQYKGRLSLTYDDEAGWLDDAMWNLEKSLSAFSSECGFGIPLEAWRAEVYYKSYEDPDADGSIVTLRIANGRIYDFMESRIEMVEVEPWVKFDLTKED